MKNEKELRQLFKNKSDCYTQIVKEGKHWPDIEMAMTEDCFIEVLRQIGEGKQQSDPEKTAILPHISGSAFVIMFQKKPLKNILFQSDKEARNYIKMQNPKRKFKEPKENVFVCSRYGTTFEIIELHYR